jgi:hypothetical protein
LTKVLLLRLIFKAFYVQTPQMRRFLSRLLFLALLCFFGKTNYSFAQACNPAAGSVSAANSRFCPIDSFQVSLSSAQTDPAYDTELWLCSKDRVFLQKASTSLRFGEIPVGQYLVFSYNFLKNNPASTAPAVGGTVGALLTSAQGCYDLSAPLAVEMHDSIPPVARCFNDTLRVFLTAQGIFQLSLAQFDNASSDNCGLDTLLLTKNQVTCGDQGRLQVGLVAVDKAGLKDTCFRWVVVRDTIKPSLTCRNFTAYLGANGQVTIPPDSLARVIDNCGSVQLSIAQSNFSCLDFGLQNIQVTARDLAGNTLTCNSQLNILDTIPPQAKCRSTRVYLDANGRGTLTATQVNNNSSDNCGLGILNLGKSNFTCADLSLSEVTLYVRDDAENLSSCIAELEVLDTIKPTARCKPATLYLNASGTASLQANMIDNSSSDNCGILTRVASRRSFSCADLGTQNIDLTIIDNSGNGSTCQAQVTILDTIRPIARCKPVNVYLNATGTATLNAAQVNNGSTDNCQSSLQFSLSTSTFSCNDIGSQSLVFTARDASNNFQTCLATVTVLDTVRPNAQCRSGLRVKLDSEGQASLTALQVNNGSSDCDGIASLELSKTDFTCADLGIQNLVLTVRDSSGNVARCTTSLMVIDTIKPVARCKSIEAFLGANGQVLVNAESLNNGSSDNCPSLRNFSLSKNTFNCQDKGIQQVWFRVQDGSGNQDSCQALITVRDTISPKAQCKPANAYLNTSGVAIITPAMIELSSSDNCGGILEKSLSLDRFTCVNLGPNQVSLTVKDSSNNVQRCIAVVTILDTIPPLAICQDLTIYLDSLGKASITPEQVDSESRDNCGLVQSRVLSKANFTCADLGVQTVRLTESDGSGNKHDCTARITVKDTIKPIIKCRNATIFLGPDGQALLSLSQVNAGSSDNCGNLSLSLSKTIFTCVDRGERTVTLRGVDPSGNRDSCVLTVKIVDQIKPIAKCKNITLSLKANGRVIVKPQDLNNGSNDNCIIDSIAIDKTEFNCQNIGENLVSFKVWDAERNAAECLALITIVDSLPPVVICPLDLEVNSNADGDQNCSYTVGNLRLDPSGVSDNCKLKKARHNYVAASNDSTLLGAVFPVGLSTVTWTLEDVNGQKSTCTIKVTVKDVLAPVARLRDTILVKLNPNGSLSIDSSMVDRGSSDNCGIAIFQLSKKNFTCADVGFQRVNITLRDAAGNQTQAFVIVGIAASSACGSPRIANAKGPRIGDPCSCRGNGLFDEEVVIGPSRPNQIWRVKQTTLRDSLNNGVYAIGTRFREIKIKPDSSIYVLRGVHSDGQGYVLEAESPLFDTVLRISNRCFYPKPQITNLDQAICLFTPPITMQGNGGQGVQGTGSFTVNGVNSTVFNPRNLGPGNHQVVFTFNAGNPAGLLLPKDVGCTASVTRSVQVQNTPPVFSCRSSINLSVNNTCEVLITPEMLLVNKFPCYDDFEVILNANGQLIPNPVPPSFAGGQIIALIRYRPNPNLASCTSTINLSDVSGPQMDNCPRDIESGLVCSDFDSLFNNPKSIDPTHRLFIGVPRVQDNCTGTSLSFQDQELGFPACNSTYVRGFKRTFIARDRFGNTSSCFQFVYFRRPGQIFFPNDTLVKTNCKNPALPIDRNGNLASSVSGAPYYINGFGKKVEITENLSSCSYGANYTDTRFAVCGNRYSLFRIWRVLDWCDPSRILEKRQYIEVGDFDKPLVDYPVLDLDRNGVVDDTLRYRVAADFCGASFAVPNPKIEDCSPTTVRTEIWSWRPEVDQFGFPSGRITFQKLDLIDLNGQARNVPLGTHYFIFRVKDICNQETLDTAVFKVVDEIVPQMICAGDYNLSLGGQGLARIRVSDINRNSRDNCDQSNLQLDIRRLISADCDPGGLARFGEWGPDLDLTCCDAGKLVTIELRGRDKSGNTNTCVTRIRVEDKLPPTCTPPVDRSINCNALPAGFHPDSARIMQAAWGVPSVNDNCSATWIELKPSVNLDGCGVGSIVRRFQARDASGNLSNSICEQSIRVLKFNNYEIKFPKDATNFCGSKLADTIELKKIACDRLLLNVEDKILASPNSGCYQILRTFSVINDCEYDGSSPPIILSRDADCDVNPGDENLFLLVRNGVTYLDRDRDESNNIPAANQKGASCDGQSNPAGHWANSNANASLRSRGFWQYTQVITVIDTVRPVIEVAAPAPYCANSSEVCQGAVDLPFLIRENCGTEGIQISGRIDIDANGGVDRTLSAADFTGSYPNYRFRGTFPIGTHRLWLEVRDGCGNRGLRSIDFQVVDCKAPAPICISGLSVTLQALNPRRDVDGDGTLDQAYAVVKASNFVGSSISDCSGPVRYSINREGRMANINQDSVVLTCKDEGTVYIELWAWDRANNPTAVQPDGRRGGPNAGMCLTFVSVQNNGRICVPVPQGSISGLVRTDNDAGVMGVEMRLSGASRGMVKTDQRGMYSLDTLEEGKDYTVTPWMDLNPSNGVSTLDLIIIRKHILNIAAITSPYRLIAADANFNQAVSTSDLIAIQKLVLGINDRFLQGPSWRFVDAKFSFTDPNNPWSRPFPEVLNINNLKGKQVAFDFIGIKVGDVSGNARVSLEETPELRSGHAFVDLKEQQFEAGETFSVPFHFKNLADLQGYQLGLAFDQNKLDLIEIEHLQTQASNFAVFAGEGLLNANWYGEGTKPDPKRAMFNLKFRAKQPGILSEDLDLSARRMVSEAYFAADIASNLKLRFNQEKVVEQGFELLQNAPNPFHNQTQIGVYLPEAGAGTLQVFDATGRLLENHTAHFAKGLNQIELQGNKWPSGLLYYHFRCGQYEATRKMVRQ